MWGWILMGFMALVAVGLIWVEHYIDKKFPELKKDNDTFWR